MEEKGFLMSGDLSKSQWLPPDYSPGAAPVATFFYGRVCCPPPSLLPIGHFPAFSVDWILPWGTLQICSFLKNHKFGRSLLMRRV